MYEQKFGVSPLDKLFPMKVDFKSSILPRRKFLKWQHTRLGFVASIHEVGHCDGFISEFARPPSQVRTFSLLPKDLTFIFLIPYLHMRCWKACSNLSGIYTGHHCKVISKSSAL